MTIVALLLSFIVTAYCTWKKGGCLDSISETSYIIPNWMFTVWISGIALLLFPAILNHLPENLHWMGFISIAGLIAVAASPFYRTEFRIMHYAGGWVCGIGFIIIVFLNSPWILLGWLLYPIIMCIKKLRKWVFWMEIITFIMLIFSMM